eukprot:GEMP01052270.1.p1 GENE.GEMP01052270.1~~GEMP01052270.1.p1  ORF type:complete len:111 (+),score=23.57 GEMP01052270.1:210-542(+)
MGDDYSDNTPENRVTLSDWWSAPRDNVSETVQSEQQELNTRVTSVTEVFAMSVDSGSESQVEFGDVVILKEGEMMHADVQGRDERDRDDGSWWNFLKVGRACRTRCFICA